jgi:glycosyltransferase involved in cell wall biosynthesis
MQIRNNNKVLTICIPTYNRSEYIRNQLSFFHRQIQKNSNILNSVRFIISDNASTDETLEILKTLQNEYNFFEYTSNKLNLGLVGNIISLLNSANTKYVWFVSDDDIIKDGVIEEVINIISCNNAPEFIFVNYSFKGKKGFNGNTGIRFDSKNAALEVYQQAYGSLVLISSCIYKKENIIELNTNLMFQWLSAPLLYSFYSCTKGPVYITKEDWIIFNSGNASYAGFIRILKLKFEEYVTILEYLPQIGYEKSSVMKTIQFFFENQSHAHFLYNFVDFFKSIRFYKYYKLKTFFKIPINFFFWFFAINCESK